MIKKVRVHTCQQKIAGFLEQKCRCRKFVPQEKADRLKADGNASNIILSYRTIEVEVKCPICDGLDALKLSCLACGKTGKTLQKENVYQYGEDIYMTPFRKTPRAATIESKHIAYAFVKGDKDAAKRIELYHQSDQLALIQLGAELRDSRTGEILFEGRPEPKDDPKTATGRNYDYGRAI